MTTATAPSVGKIVQVIGPVLDVEFPAGHLPELYNALEITATSESGQAIRVVAEVQQQGDLVDQSLQLLLQLL